MSQSPARAARRAAARHVHVAFEFPLELAIRLNCEMPIPGLAAILYEIRAECGPDTVVALCPDCETVGVV